MAVTPSTQRTNILAFADGALLADLAHANLQPGRTENECQVAIRTLRAAIPIAAPILEATGTSR